MLLILTNSRDATADFLVPILNESETSFLRLDTDTITDDLKIYYRPAGAAFHVGDVFVTPYEVSHVWYRRPERLTSTQFGDSPEGRFALSEWSEAVEGFLSQVPRQRWMNHPSANALASNKLDQMTIARSLGFSIPDTLVTQDKDEAREFINQHELRVIVKPLSSGYIERQNGADSLIYTNRVTEADLDALSDVAACPTLFQQFVRKATDVRITVVDDAMHSIALYAKEPNGEQRCDVRRDNMADVRYELAELPPKVATMVRSLMSHYGLRFAAIDMVVDLNGVWHFLEINPNGQWAWMDILGASRIAPSFVDSFSHAR